MSNSTSALKASKSIVDSYVSSTERSDLTTTFTENTPTLTDSVSKKNIIQTILGVVKHPKFKWIVIAILLCVCVFVYFKSQNKQTKKEQIEDTRLDIIQDKNGRPMLVDLKEKEYMDKISQLEQKEKQLQEKINQINANNIRSNNNQQDAQKLTPQVAQQAQQAEAAHRAAQQATAAAQRAQQAQQAAAAQRAAQQAQQAQHAQQAQQAAAAQRAQQTQQAEAAQRAQQAQQAAAANRAAQHASVESESSEEVFIENENVMNHNLTRDEMNAIDKQLEDINIDDMGYESN